MISPNVTRNEINIDGKLIFTVAVAQEGGHLTRRNAVYKEATQLFKAGRAMAK